MPRHASARPAVHVLIPVLFALPLLLLALPAHAQLGGLVRKAKSAATGEASRRSGATAALEGQDVAFDDATLELTPELLDQVIRGLQAGQAANTGQLIVALADERDKLANEAADLHSKHGTAIDAHNGRRSDVDRCRDDAFRVQGDAREKALQQRALTDPAFRAKVMAMTMKLGEAQAKSDTTALRTFEREFRILSGENKADTARVDSKCGAAIPPHAMDLRIQSLHAQARELDQKVRDVEQQATEDEAKAAGMTVRQFGMARERIVMYLARVKANSQQRGLTSTELKALEARRSTLAGLA